MFALLLQSLLACTVSAQEHGPFTPDFVQFLNSNPKRNEGMLEVFNEYGSTGTFGGKQEGDEEIIRQPVIFVHGNSDSALFHSNLATGWTRHVEYFKSKGYNSGELYGMTYGDRNLTNAIHNRISCKNIIGLRRLIEAVLAYTQAEKVDIIAHSMGVTLARKAIQGGQAMLTEELCDIGESISDKIDTIVGISGANRGMCLCLIPLMKDANACSAVDGFFPGTCKSPNANYEQCGKEFASCEKKDYATILKTVELIEDGEADFVASLWSKDDEVLGMNNIAWGEKTSVIPNSHFTFEYQGLSHDKTKTETIMDQYALVTRHSRNAATIHTPSRARRSHTRKHHKHQH